MEKGGKQKPLFRNRKGGRAARALALLAVLCAAFGMRAWMIALPAVSAEDQAALRDERGDPYLTDMDSYFYLRKAAEMAESGRVQWFMNPKADPLTGSRTGAEKEEGLLPLGLSALTCLIWRYLLSFLGFSLTQTALWMGPALGSLAALPAFWYGRKRTSLAGGCACGLLVGCAVPFLLHTHAGFFDTDMLLAFLPLTALLSLSESMRESALRAQLKYALVSAAAFAGLALIWPMYYVYYLLGAACAALTLLLRLLLPGGRNQSGRMLRGGALSLGLAMVCFLILEGPACLRRIAGVGQAYLQASAGSGGMPYAYYFTQEMQPLDLLPARDPGRWILPGTGSLPERLGGIIPLLLASGYALFALISLFRPTSRASSGPNRPSRTFPLLPETCFLLPWAAAGIFLALRGKRFAEIAVLPVSLMAGLAMGHLFPRIQARTGRRPVYRALASLLLAALLLPWLWSAWRTPRENAPLVNHNLEEAMSFLREATPPETAVAAWWDDGYYAEYQARRRTLLDGGTHSGKTDFFLAKALLSPDPKTAAGILRMLNESGTAALDELTAHGLTPAEAADLLLRLLPLERSEAESLLREKEISLSLLEMTHPPSPAPLVLMLSTDLLQKYRALAYYGFWSPAVQAQRENGLILTPLASKKLENGRAEIPLRRESPLSLVLQETPENGFQVSYLYKGKAYTPCRTEIWENGRRVFRKDSDSDRPAVILVREGDRYCGVLCTENLADSLLIRLLVCEDQNYPGFLPLGTWYAPQAADQTKMLLRADPASLASRTIQLWQAAPYGEADLSVQTP